MALSGKMKDTTEQAKMAAAKQKGRLEETAHKAEQHVAEARERLAKAREHTPHGKSKRNGA